MLNIYRASAGSGKTYRLTRDYIRLLFNPKKSYNHRHILAVTFTNKATDEMKSRILKELYCLTKGEKSDYREELMEQYDLNETEVKETAEKILIEILHDYTSFSISTIDRFFQYVIRAFARDIGVNGGYSLELDSNQILEQAVDNLFMDLSKEENKQLLQWLTELTEERIEQSENWNIRRNLLDLGKEIFKENFQYKADEINRKLHDHTFLQAFRQELRSIKQSFEKKVTDKCGEALQIIARYSLTPENFKGGSRSAMKSLEKFERLDFNVSDAFLNLHQDVSFCYTKTTSAENIGKIHSAYNDGLQKCLSSLSEYLTQDIILYNSATIILKHISTLGILSDLAMQIKKLTEEQNLMLISDTNMLLNRIIDNSDTPFVYERTGIYVDNYMIDEFQDTSVLQWKNFKPLLSNSLAQGKSNLVVGDVKQSIYRWRNSDWKLLDEQILTDFLKEQLNEENLEINWRSDKNIVEFNNFFFRQASVILQEKLNENIEPSLSAYHSLSQLKDKILHAYTHVHQAVSPKALDGYVKISFISEDEVENNWKEKSLKKLPALLEELQDRGYTSSDVGILVRKNDEEQQIIEYLLHYKNTSEAKSGYCYDVMGNEGLLVNSSSAVRFIVGVLKLYINPLDTIQQAVVNHEYLRGKRSEISEEAFDLLFSTNNPLSKEDSLLFTEEEKEKLRGLRNYALYEIIEQIIHIFDMGNWKYEALFLQAFQDIVLKFSTGKTTDLNSFLLWWEKHGEKQTIPSPENPHAFRIMTIHKSKGLDFNVVIIPFCDWDLDSRMRNILWCKTSVSPFNQFPLMPIEYNSKLSKSIFAEEYFEEQMHQYIDNLNIGYVAFTRAKNELYSIAPAPKKEITGIEKINSFSALLYSCFRKKEIDFDLCRFFDEENNILEIGKPLKKENSPTSSNTENIVSYPTFIDKNRLKLRIKNFDIIQEEKTIYESPLNYGNIMHNILHKITGKENQEEVVHDFIMKGMITEEESIVVRKGLEDFWKEPETISWFSPHVKVLNETTIINTDGNLYRPDRIVIDGENVTVIDYKFGEKENDGYVRQIEKYMEVISKMNYQVEGVIYYISLGKLIKINN